MRTVKSLREELAKFPDDALCHVYEGESFGIVVKENVPKFATGLQPRQGFIHCESGERNEPETETLEDCPEVIR